MVGHKKRLVGNFISLSLVQGLTILFPLITFPYLLRVFGVKGFGIFTLIQTFIMYFDLLVSFGFSLTATQQISKNINNPGKTKEIIATVYIIQLILFSISVLVFFGCSLFIPFLRENILIVVVSALYLLGNLLFPDWYFQGIQKMRNITIIAFISKSISLLLIILLVKRQTDIVYAVLSLSAGNFIAGLIGFSILARTISFHFIIPKKEFIISLFKESSYVFTSIILAPLYSSVNLFILQVITNPLMVGYYAISEKIFSAISMLTSIANRTFYPHLTQLYDTSITTYKAQIKKIVFLFIAVFSLIALVQFFAAKEIITIIAGKNYKEDISYAIVILKIMSFGLLFSPFVSFFFQQMIIQDQKKKAIRNIAITVILNLVNGCLLTYFFSGKGMAVNLCITIFTIATLNYTSFRKKLNATMHEL